MSSKKTIKKVAWSAVGLLVLIVAVFGYVIYKRLFSPNVMTGKLSTEFVYIPTGSNFNNVVSILEKQHLIRNEKTFRWTAQQMKYENAVKPGKYRLKANMTNKELVSLLRAGKQQPVNVIFNNIRTKQQLADRISEQIEASSPAILNLLNDHDYTGRIGFTPDNILAMFIPNTYEFYWNTSPDKFIQRMAKEYKKFWTAERVAKARNHNFSQVQVSIIASIVQQESNKEDEKPLIAGVYINRYRKDWKLEADPTLVYALGNFTINRVLNIYKQIDSPYNTYKYKGLPPGPICLPTVRSIDAVLNFSKHNYMYFCAKDDFSGYHSFASTLAQHSMNARKFQKALDRRKIVS
jgi:UPF0755 protein